MLKIDTRLFEDKLSTRQIAFAFSSHHACPHFTQLGMEPTVVLSFFSMGAGQSHGQYHGRPTSVEAFRY